MFGLSSEMFPPACNICQAVTVYWHTDIVGGGDFTLYMRFFFETCQLQNFDSKSYDSKRWQIPKTSSLVTVRVYCMAFGNVCRRPTELLLLKSGTICVLELDCANRNTMKGMWPKAWILRVLAVCLPNGGGGEIFFGLLAGVTGCCCMSPCCLLWVTGCCCMSPYCWLWVTGCCCVSMDCCWIGTTRFGTCDLCFEA